MNIDIIGDIETQTKITTNILIYLYPYLNLQNQHHKFQFLQNILYIDN